MLQDKLVILVHSGAFWLLFEPGCVISGSLLVTPALVIL